MRVPIQDMLFLHLGQKGLGGPDCTPHYFEWMPVPTGTPARFYVDLCMRDAPNQPHPRVGWLVEAPPYAQCHYDWAVEHEKEFDAILTHQQAYAERGHPWRWYPRGGSLIPIEKWGRHNKVPNSVSMIASNKRDARGHKLRWEIYSQFDGMVETWGSITGKPLTDKTFGLANYEFSIVVEGERNEGGFSDHLIDCLAMRTVPIYWGCPNIGDYFDPDGIIPFERVQELRPILDNLSTQDYQRRAKAIEMNYLTALHYRIPEDWIWENCRDLFGGLE